MAFYKIKINTPKKSEVLDLSEVFTIGQSPECDYQIDFLASKHLTFTIKEETLLLINHVKSGTYLKDQELKEGKKYILEDNDTITFGDLEIIVLSEQKNIEDGDFTSSEIDISLNPSNDLEFDEDEDDDLDEEDLMEVAAPPTQASSEEEKEDDDDLDIDIDDDAPKKKAPSNKADDLDLSMDVEEEEEGKDLPLGASEPSKDQDDELDLNIESPLSTFDTPSENLTKEVVIDLPTSNQKVQNIANLDLDEDDEENEKKSIKSVKEENKDKDEDDDDDIPIDEGSSNSIVKPSFFHKVFSFLKKNKKNDVAIDEDDTSKEDSDNKTNQDGKLSSIKVSSFFKSKKNAKTNQEESHSSEETSSSGLDLSGQTSVESALSQKREEKTENKESTASKKSFFSIFRFFKRKKKSSATKAKKKGFLRNFFYKLNIFRSRKIFQVNFKVRLYLLVATMAIINILGYQILPHHELNQEIEPQIEFLSKFVKKDYLTNIFIPELEKKIPPLEIKATKMETELIHSANEVSKKAAAIIKQNAKEYGLNDYLPADTAEKDNVEAITPTPIPDKAEDKPRKKRGQFKKDSKLPPPPVIKIPTPVQVKESFTLSHFILSNVAVALPKIKDIINKLGSTHDKYAVMVTRFIVIYLVYELFWALLLGVSFTGFIYGVRIDGNFLVVRFKAILRTILFFIFMPLFFITELSVMFNRRSLKEVLSFSSYELRPSRIRTLIIFVILPIIIISPLLTPFLKNQEAFLNIAHTEYVPLPPFQVKEGRKVENLSLNPLLTPNEFKYGVVGFDVQDLSLPLYIYTYPSIRNEDQNILSGLYLYDITVKDYLILEKGKSIDLLPFINRAKTDNPFFDKFFPNLHQLLKVEKNVTWNDQHAKELFKLLMASIKLNLSSFSSENLINAPHQALLGFFDYIISFGPLINGYVDGRNEIYNLFKGQNVQFKFRSLNNQYFLYYSTNNNPLFYCFAPIQSTTLNFSCVDAKENLSDLLSFIENNLLTKASFTSSNEGSLSENFNALDSAHYLFALSGKENFKQKNSSIIKYYQNLAFYAYQNGESYYINFVKRVLGANLQFLESLSQNRQAAFLDIIFELKNILPKLKSKENCQEDTHCFANSIKQCSRAEMQLKHQARINNIKLFYQKRLLVTGRKKDLCQYIVHYTTVNTDYDDETKSKLKETGKDDNGIQQAVRADTKEFLEEHNKIYSCIMDPEEFSPLFDKWRSNTYNPGEMKNCSVITEIVDQYE